MAVSRVSLQTLLRSILAYDASDPRSRREFAGPRVQNKFVFDHGDEISDGRCPHLVYEEC